jgi:hypothetical protein
MVIEGGRRPTSNVLSKSWRPFEEARIFVRGLNLKSTKEYRDYCKSGNRPDDIPSAPNMVYADSGWIGWGDWLGKRTVKPNATLAAAPNTALGAQRSSASVMRSKSVDGPNG